MDQELSNFAARIAAEESTGYWGLRFLIAGLLGELIISVFPLKRDILNRIAGVVFVIFVIVGCLLEYRSETQVSRLASQEEANAGIKIADANKRANEAAAYAASLGASVGNLRGFVASREQEIGKTFAQFKKFSTDQNKRTDAAIADLNVKRQELERARSDALAAAANAEKSLAGIADVRQNVTQLQAKAAARHLTDAQKHTLSDILVHYKGQKVDIRVGDDPEAGQYANELDDVFTKAGWKSQVTGVFYTHSSPIGLRFLVSKKDVDAKQFTPAVHDVALTLINLGLLPDKVVFPADDVPTGTFYLVVGSRTP